MNILVQTGRSKRHHQQKEHPTFMEKSLSSHQQLSEPFLLSTQTGCLSHNERIFELTFPVTLLDFWLTQQTRFANSTFHLFLSSSLLSVYLHDLVELVKMSQPLSITALFRCTCWSNLGWRSISDTRSCQTLHTANWGLVGSIWPKRNIQASCTSKDIVFA